MTPTTFVTPIALARRVGVAPQEVYQAMSRHRDRAPGTAPTAAMIAAERGPTGHWQIRAEEADRWATARKERRADRAAGLTREELQAALDAISE